MELETETSEIRKLGTISAERLHSPPQVDRFNVLVRNAVFTFHGALIGPTV